MQPSSEHAATALSTGLNYTQHIGQSDSLNDANYF